MLVISCNARLFIHIDRQIDRQIDTWIGRQIDGYMDRQIDRQITRQKMIVVTCNARGSRSLRVKVFRPANMCKRELTIFAQSSSNFSTCALLLSPPYVCSQHEDIMESTPWMFFIEMYQFQALGYFSIGKVPKHNISKSHSIYKKKTCVKTS